MSRCALVLLLSSIGCGGSDPVKPPAAVASVTVTPLSHEFDVGGTQTFQAQVKDAAGNVLTGRTVTWTSSQNSVASVSDAGVVTALAGGASIITATSEGKSGTAAITVRIPVASVEIEGPGFVQIGGTASLTARTLSSSGANLQRPVTWSSSNEAIVAVNGSGALQGVASGTATITATSEGKTKSIEVTATPVASATMTYPNFYLPEDTDFQLALVGKNTAGAVVQGVTTPTWSAVAPSTVSASGVLRAGFGPGGSVTGTLDGIAVQQGFFGAPVLENNETITGIFNGSSESSYVWVINVPQNATRLLLTITGPNGDADLLLGFPSQTANAATACYPQLDGSNETCDIPNPQPGYWIFVLDTFAPYTGVELKLAITTGAGAIVAGMTAKGESTAPISLLPSQKRIMRFPQR